MVRRKSHRLEYYHTGCYGDLSKYKLRKIEKDILEQLDSKDLKDICFHVGATTVINSEFQISSARVGTFDETGISLPRNPSLSSSKAQRKKTEAKVDGSNCCTTP